MWLMKAASSYLRHSHRSYTLPVGGNGQAPQACQQRYRHQQGCAAVQEASTDLAGKSPARAIFQLGTLRWRCWLPWRCGACSPAHCKAEQPWAGCLLPPRMAARILLMQLDLARAGRTWWQHACIVLRVGDRRAGTACVVQCVSTTLQWRSRRSLTCAGGGLGGQGSADGRVQVVHVAEQPVACPLRVAPAGQQRCRCLQARVPASAVQVP